MKNFNLINWLRGGSTLRQTGQESVTSNTMWRNVAMILLLCLGVGNAWAYEMIMLNQSTGAWNDQFLFGGDNQTVNTDSKTIDGNSYSKYVVMSGTCSAPTQYDSRVIRYDVKTNNVTIDIYAYSTESSTAKAIYVALGLEGGGGTIDASSENISAGSGLHITKTFNSSAITSNASIYVYTASTKVRFYQIKITESGTRLPLPGEGGYSYTFNKGRAGVSTGKTKTADSLLIIANPASNYSATSASTITLNKSTGYVQFTARENCELTVTRANNVAYYFGTVAAPTSTTVSNSADNTTKTFELTSGTSYRVSGGGGSNLQLTSLSFASAAPSCTAPNHVDVSGRWDRFGGETISLTATAYSSDGTGSPIADANITGWQWQKLIGTTWTDVSNGTAAGVTTSGATTKNLQIANCGSGNSGKYRCVVSTGATCSTASATATDGSEGFGVKVYTLECYTGGTTVYNFTRTGDSQAGTVQIDLSASTSYTFKVVADGVYYGNNGTVNEDATNWVMCSSGDAVCSTNLTVNSGLGGTFTFSMDYSTSGSSSVLGEPEISVTYPRKRIYLSPGVWDVDGAKFAYYYFRDGGSAAWTDFLTSDDCGMYADIPQWNGVKVIAGRINGALDAPAFGDGKCWNQTGDLTVTSNDYIVVNNWDNITYNSIYSMPTYTISYDKGLTTYAGGNSISGSKSNGTKTCGTDFTLPSSAVFTTTGYTQTGWATTQGTKAFNLGGSYTDNEAQTFYPYWTINTYTLTASATVINPMTEESKTGAITGSFTNNPISSVPYGTSTTTSSNTFTANGTTVTAAATIAGSSAECDECTYRFDSWENIPATVTADVNTIHAKYNTTYSITYNKDGGSWAGGYSAPAYYVYGTGATLPTGSNITKEHYSFDGWTLSGSTPDLVNGWGNITLDANWSANTYDVDFTFYNVSYSSGDDEGDDAATYGTAYTVVVAASSGHALPSSITVTIGGDEATEDTEYTWDKSTGTVTIGGSYILGDIEIEITADEDASTYSVTYAKPDGATGTPPEDETAYDSGDEVTVKSNTDIAKDGTTFRGWTDGMTFYLVGQKFNITSDVTLTAVLDGGSSCTEYEMLMNSGSLASETSSNPRGHYISGVGKIMKNGDGSSNASSLADATSCHGSDKSMPTSSSTIFLRTYNAINKVTVYGIPSGKNRTVASVKTATNPASYSSDIKSTCVLTENMNVSGECGDIVVEFPSTLAANTYIAIALNNGNAGITGILFENCTKSNFTVSFADGNTAPASHLTLPDDIEGVPTGKKILQPSTTPTASGYIFGGWYTDSSCTSAWIWGSSTVSKDTTLYAKWTEKSTPTKYNVMGTPVGLCGEETATITLAGSQSGISYQLKKDGEPEGDPKAGTGSSLSWTGMEAGVYTIWTVENATYKSVQMDNSGYTTVTVTDLTPTAINTQPTTAVAAGAGVNFTLGENLDAEGENLEYQWYSYTSSGGAGEAPISGANEATYTTSKSAGTYYYKVEVSGDCGDPVYSSMITVTVTASHSVTVSYNGSGSYGTASAASSSVAEGGTTTITASPATGYWVTAWAASGTGASVSDNGSTHSNTTTLTMGTADATVTCTFGAKTYSITLDRGIGTSGSTSVTMTYKSSSHSSITAPSVSGYTFTGWYTGEGGTGSMVMNASGTLQASVSGYTDESGNWTKDATCTLYAKYEANYPDGYLYITDVMATPEAKAGYTITMTKNSANYNGTLGSTLQTNRAGYEYWADATGSSGNITLSFSDALPASATAGGMIIDVWWGADSNNRTTSIALNGGSAEQLDAANTSTGDRDIVKKATYATELKSLSSITLSCSGGNTVWFRIGIKDRPGYLLTYDANDGTGAPSAEYKPNATITLSSTEPTRSGYIFRGWQVGGSGTVYQPDDEFSMPASAVTLVAKWTAVCMSFTAATSGSSDVSAGTTKEISTASGGYASTLSGGTMSFYGRVGKIGNNDTYGLVFDSKDDELLTVTLTDAMFEAGTVIVLDCYSVNSSSKEIGFTLSGNACAEGNYTTTANEYQRFTRTYVVTEDDGIDGTSSFTIEGATTNKVYLKGLQVAGCSSCTSISPTLTYSATTLYAFGGTPRGAVPTLTGNTGNGTVAYSSSNTSVVTVDSETGVVTAVGAGTATVTAVIEPNDGYCGAIKSVNFTVPALVTQTVRTGSSQSWNGDGSAAPNMTFNDPSSTLTQNAVITWTGYTFDATANGSADRGGMTAKFTGVPSSTSKDASYYLSLKFNSPTYDVRLGKVIVPIQPVSQTVSAIATLDDGTTTITSNEVADITAGKVAQATFTFTPTVLKSGTITLKVYVYDQTTGTNGFRLATPITISGAVLSPQTYSDAGSGLWSDPANWDGGALPEIYHDVVLENPIAVDIAHATAKSIVLDQNSHTGKLTIQPNKGLEVVGTITRTTDGSNSLATREEDLVLESSTAGNASLIFNNSNSNQATVQMYSKAGIDGDTWNWQYVGTPFTGSIPSYNYYGSWMYKWNGGWEVVHGNDELTPFAGYCLTQESATTHVMGGTLVPTTSKSVTMAASTDMVLANSWTAAISIAAFEIEGGDATFTSTPATIYLFNTGSAEDGSEAGSEAGTYIAVPINSAPYTGNGLIAPMQGFFVTTNGGNAGTITMNYDALVRPSGSHTDIVAGPMKAPRRAQEADNKPAVLKMWANGSEYNDRVVILEREDFSEGFDNGWDGEKMSFGNASPSVYVINAQGGYDAVSAIPTLEGTVVGFRAGADSQYTMTFSYEGEDEWYLNDLQTETSTLISGEQTYSFAAEKEDSEVRFVISKTPIQKVPTGVEDAVSGQQSAVRKVLINDHIYIIRGGRIYSADGQLVK